MAYASVIVHSVEDLDKYYHRLLESKDELESLLNELSADCREQNNNWADHQYREFAKKLEAFTSDAGRLLQEDLQEAIEDVANVLKHLQ